MAYSRKKRVGVRRRRYGRQRYMRGHGKYWTPARFVPRGTFRKYGRRIGAHVGSKSLIAPGIASRAGGALGGYLGGKVAQLVGWGDYHVRSNTLMPGSGRMVPSFGKDSIRIKKRELVAIVSSTAAFSNLTFPIQPGLDVSFPWLSRIAANYENYHFNGLVYQFHSTSSDAIASTTDLGLGTVALCTDYNATDAPYPNMITALGTTFANSGKPSEDIYHAVECAPKEQQQKSYYIRTGDQPLGTDIRLNDMGNFQFIVDGVADYDGMGQLWVSYDITLFKSVQNNTEGLAINQDIYSNTGPLTTAFSLGSALVREAHPRNNLGTRILNNQTIIFPPTLSSGFYQINVTSTGTTAVITRPVAVLVNCETVNTFFRQTQSLNVSANGQTAANYFYQATIRITQNGATYQLQGTAVLPTGGGALSQIEIIQLNAELITNPY